MRGTRERRVGECRTAAENERWAARGRGVGWGMEGDGTNVGH